MRKLKIAWQDFEAGCDDGGGTSTNYLDLTTGAVITVFEEHSEMLEELLENAPDGASIDEILAEAEVPDWEKDELRRTWRVREGAPEELLRISSDDFRVDHRDLSNFTATIGDPKLRVELERAINGPGAFKRFRNLIHQTFRERKQWFAFEAACRREKATAWLATHGVEAEWVLPHLPAESGPTGRQHLLEGVVKFVEAAAKLPGISRVALIGSLTREQPDPKDADLLVTVSDDMDLTPLAKAARKLSGHAQQQNRGADVFLVNPRGEYIGRTCPWRDCGPQFRVRCDAQHCGRRHYLHDDMESVRLDKALIANPPVDLWPKPIAHVPVPADVQALLNRLTPGEQK